MANVVADYKLARPSVLKPASEVLTDKYVDLANNHNIPSKAYTLPLYSYAHVVGEVFAWGSGSACFIVFHEGQTMNFFNYAQNGSIPSGLAAPNQTQVVTEFHTNLTEPSKTPMNMDFAIESIHAVALSPMIVFPQIPPVLNEDVQAAFTGRIPLVDPAAAVTPPQFGSPQNLEYLFDSALRQHILISMGWGDGRSLDPLGMIDSCFDGTARSYLRTAGEPVHGNGLYQPEGHLWLGTSLGTDSKFQMKGELIKSVVVYAQMPVWPGGDATVFPSRVIVPYKMMLNGLGMVPLGMNA